MIKKAFSDDSIHKAQIKFWYRHFKYGWESCKSDPHSGTTFIKAEHLKFFNVCRVQSTKIGDLTVQELEDLGIPQTIVSQILMQRILV